MPSDAKGRGHGRRSPRPLDMPQQPPPYAQNPLGVPHYTPAGWTRRPWREWSFAILVAVLALPLVLALIARLLGV